MDFHFERVLPSQRELIHTWLKEPHISEWIHGNGLQNTLDDLEKSFQGDANYQHWIGYLQDVPFSYLLTSLIDKSGDDELAILCTKEGEAITLDLFICDPKFLGKGLSVPMIREFLLQKFPYVTEVFIDPEKANTKAVHVYQKVGFEIVGESIPSWHQVPHYKMILDMRKWQKKS